MTEANNQSPARYPSDLNDDEWEILSAIFDELEPYTTGRPRKSDLREILIVPTLQRLGKYSLSIAWARQVDHIL